MPRNKSYRKLRDGQPGEVKWEACKAHEGVCPKARRIFKEDKREAEARLWEEMLDEVAREWEEGEIE